MFLFFFFSSRRRHTRCSRDWSSDVCSSDLVRAKTFLSIHYWWWRAYDSAAMWADSAVATDPLYGLGRVVAGQVALSRGRRDEAESQLDAARRLPTGPGSNGLSGFVSLAAATADTVRARSEERRVGKECR